MMPDPTPTAQAEADKRAHSLNEAERLAWDHLARAVDPSREFNTRRREADMAAALFTCVAAVVGQPTLTMPASGDTEPPEALSDHPAKPD